MISKEFFISCIDAIAKEEEYIHKFNQVVSDLLEDGGGWPKIYACKNKLVEWLQNELNDGGPQSVIEWYLWELDFGKKADQLHFYINQEQRIVDTPENLYDLLIELKTVAK